MTAKSWKSGPTCPTLPYMHFRWTIAHSQSITVHCQPISENILVTSFKDSHCMKSISFFSGRKFQKFCKTGIKWKERLLSALTRYSSVYLTICLAQSTFSTALQDPLIHASRQIRTNHNHQMVAPFWVKCKNKVYLMKENKISLNSYVALQE